MEGGGGGGGLGGTKEKYVCMCFVMYTHDRGINRGRQ